MKLGQDIAARINELMQEKGVTKEELAERTHLPLQTVEEILGCEYDAIGLHTIFVICRALDIFLKDFFQVPVQA